MPNIRHGRIVWKRNTYFNVYAILRSVIRNNMRLIAMLLLYIFSLSAFGATYGNGDDCNDCQIRFAIKTNLFHDLVLTPDLGMEISLTGKFSFSLEGVYAWWSKDSAHSYWRIRGAWAEMRYWFGSRSGTRVLTGHHAGVYGSVHDYDFEFGNRGWQSPDGRYGVGISYGYSLCLNDRLNLDFAIRTGYSIGKVIKYKSQCGEYVCTDISLHRYWGVTGLEVTLVWFPSKGIKNKPGLISYGEN